MMSGAAALVTLGVAMGWGLPAIASQLTAWNYDEQTRSLHLTLPANVTPTVSVIAPNQMLVELPDTQIGDIAGQNVGDGLVESITLKQTTSDKVWMVVNFVPGTVLATQQNAVPLGGSTGSITPEGSASPTTSDPLAADASLQQWQVRPALVADSPDNGSVSASVESDTVENDTAESDTATVAVPSALSPEAASLQEGSAANLSERGDAIAQTPVFPELPILEPAMPIDAPVSVPPIDARSVPAQPAQSVPVQAAPPVQASVLAVTTPEPPESVSAEQPTANLPNSELPLEPPFIGEQLQEEVNNPVVDEPAPSEPAVAASPPTSAPTSSIGGPSADSEPANEPANAAESEVITADGSNPQLANTASPDAVIPEIDIPVEDAHTPATSRWPEPIPFGQPLP